MKDGTIPLTVQAPERAPIISSISSVIERSLILSRISSSNFFHGVLNSQVESHMHMPEAIISATWLPPQMASPPYTLITSTIIAISSTMGMSDMASRVRVFLFIASPFCVFPQGLVPWTFLIIFHPVAATNMLISGLSMLKKQKGR